MDFMQNIIIALTFIQDKMDIVLISITSFLLIIKLYNSMRNTDLYLKGSYMEFLNALEEKSFTLDSIMISVLIRLID